MEWVGIGWGGVGMVTSLAHVHIFDATSVCRSCYGNHGGVRWGGVGTSFFISSVKLAGAFSSKNTRSWRARSSVTYKCTVKRKPRRNLYGRHNDFSGVGDGLRRGCILRRDRD